jgi:hypothetical protein
VGWGWATSEADSPLQKMKREDQQQLTPIGNLFTLDLTKPESRGSSEFEE